MSTLHTQRYYPLCAQSSALHILFATNSALCSLHSTTFALYSLHGALHRPRFIFSAFVRSTLHSVCYIVGAVYSVHATTSALQLQRSCLLCARSSALCLLSAIQILRIVLCNYLIRAVCSVCATSSALCPLCASSFALSPRHVIYAESSFMSPTIINTHLFRAIYVLQLLHHPSLFRSCVHHHQLSGWPLCVSVSTISCRGGLCV